MELSMSPMLLAVFGLVTALVVSLVNALRFKVDPREPPVIYPKIPLVGHMIGMLTEGMTYYKNLHETHGHPIFTLPMLTGRTYIVASPELSSAVQKASASLSLDPIIDTMSSRMCKLSKRSAAILADPTGGEEGGISVYKRSHSILSVQALTDGSDIQLGFIGQKLNDLQDGYEVDFYRFVRKIICDASNRTFFGPENPFEKHPELFDSFWDWENGLIPFLADFYPEITARKAYRGLMACADKFVEYIERNGYKDAHHFIQERNDLHRQYGVTDIMDRAKLEVSIGLACNVNASISAFWMLNEIYSRPQLLSQLRDEVRTNALEVSGTLSFEGLKQGCPRLNAVYRETLRLYAPMHNPRWVEEDTMIAGTYFVRKGTMVQLAGSAIHQDKKLWGPDVEAFNPDRFLYTVNGSKTNSDGSVTQDKAHTLHPCAIRSFGGGKHMCPGRMFAHAEIVSLTAAMILAFDMEVIDGTSWTPPRDDKRPPLTVTKPLKAVRVKMQRRKEYEGVKWELKL